MVQDAHRVAIIGRFYPILVEAGYKVAHPRTVTRGRGWTTGMFNREIRFITAEPLPQDSRIDLSIAWPALLNGNVALRLCIRGRIIKTRERSVSVEIQRYEFRTRASTQLKLSSAPPLRIESPTLSPTKKTTTAPKGHITEHGR